MSETPKVFISYSHDSDEHRQIILELSDRFRDEGVDCFIDQYVNGAPSQGWQRWMEQQIEAADFVLIICTDIYLKRFNGEDSDSGRGVNFEGSIISQMLYDKFQQNTKFHPVIPDNGNIDHVPLILKRGSIYKFGEDYESIYRVLTSQPRAIAKPLGKKMHYPSEQTTVSSQSKVNQTGRESRNELHQQPEPIKNTSIQTSFPKHSQQPFFVPYESKGEGAIGIDEKLKAVHETITNSKKTTIGQGASFQGIGGLGKTQLAVEYAHRYRDEYDGIVWLTVDQNIDTQLVDLAEKAKWVGTDVDAKAKMDIANTRYSALKNTLLIYDNVDDYEEIQSLFPQSSNYILLTSRNDIQGFKSVPLDTLDEENSLKLLSHESNRDIEKNELVAAKTLVKKFDGLPLALEMAGAYVDHREISWNEYLSLFEAKGLSFIDKADIRGSTNHESNIRNTLSLSDELLETTNNIENIINLLAWGANEAIDQILMAKMLDEDEIELIEPVAIAKKLKILKKEEDGYILHRLVSDVWKEQRPLNSFFAERVAKCLAVYMKSIQEEFLHLRKIDRAAIQAQEWANKIESTDTRAQLLGSSAFPDFYMGRYKKALGLIDHALELLDQKSDSSILSTIYLYKGSLSNSQGYSKEAKHYFEQSLQMRTRLYTDQDHSDVAYSMNHMANILNSFGDLKTAKFYCQQALGMRLRLYPDQDHREVAMSLNDMGSILRSLREYKASKHYFQQALEMGHQLYPNQDHPEVATYLNNMGSILCDLRDYKTAKLYYQQSTEMRLRVYSDQDHPNAANSLINMGSVLNLLGANKKAESYFQQSLDMSRRLYPEQNHPDIAMSLSHLGTLSMESKKCLQAQVSLNEALRIFQSLEIEPTQQRIISENLKRIKKNIKMQQKPGSRAGRFCKDI